VSLYSCESTASRTISKKEVVSVLLPLLHHYYERDPCYIPMELQLEPESQLLRACHRTVANQPHRERLVKKKPLKQKGNLHYRRQDDAIKFCEKFKTKDRSFKRVSNVATYVAL